MTPLRTAAIEARGNYLVAARRVAYENAWIRVVEDEVRRPDGSAGIFGVIEVGRGRGGVAVLPVDEDGIAVFIREFMYAQNRLGVEVVGGGVDPGEAPLAAAKREVCEELGIVPAQWTDLGTISHMTMIARAGSQLYLARGFDRSELKPEAGSEVVSYPLRDAVDRVMRGEIVASTTCCIVLKAARLLGV